MGTQSVSTKYIKRLLMIIITIGAISLFTLFFADFHGYSI